MSDAVDRVNFLLRQDSMPAPEMGQVRKQGGGEWSWSLCPVILMYFLPMGKEVANRQRNREKEASRLP